MTKEVICKRDRHTPQYPYPSPAVARFLDLFFLMLDRSDSYILVRFRNRSESYACILVNNRFALFASGTRIIDRVKSRFELAKAGYSQPVKSE